MSLLPKRHWISPSYASRIIFKWDFKNKSCSTSILLKCVWYVCMHCIRSIVCLSSVHPFIGEIYMYQTNIRVAIFFAKICRGKDALLYFYLFSMLFNFPDMSGTVQAYQIATSGALPQGVVMATTGSAMSSPQNLSEEASRKRELRLLKNRSVLFKYRYSATASVMGGGWII